MKNLDKYEKGMLITTVLVIVLGILTIIIAYATGNDPSWYVPVKCLQ